MPRVSLPWTLAYSAARIGLGIHDMFFNAVAGFYLASYGLPNVAIGFLANERSFLGSVLQPVAGALSDRLRTPIGRRKPFLLLIAPVVPAFLLLMARPETWLMVLIFIAAPVFLSVAVVAYEVLLPDCVVPEQRGTVNGVARGLGFAGSIGLMLLAFLLWQTHPWAVFLLVACALALGFLITGLLIHEPPLPSPAPGPDSGLRTQDSGPFSYVRGLFHYRDATLYVASYFLFWVGIGGITPFITRFGHEELDIPQNETFLLLVAVLVTTFIAAAPAGWLGDRCG
ncbi:MAG: MFS transporter, partial [Chloroflexi bacterium]|nr:MFS transporter [Chloroflexota bacterium]